MKIALIVFIITMLFESITPTIVEKAFLENEIVPDSSDIAPKKILNVSYANGVEVSLGNELTPTQVMTVPSVSWEAEKDAYYTLLMVDPDAPSRSNHTLREVRHWLVMNIPECSVKNGDEVIEYLGSGPQQGTELHRYIFLVYKQPDGIIPHGELRSTKRMKANRLMTSAKALALKYNLGEPKFGNFYQAQYDKSVDMLHAQFID